LPLLSRRAPGFARSITFTADESTTNEKKRGKKSSTLLDACGIFFFSLTYIPRTFLQPDSKRIRNLSTRGLPLYLATTIPQSNRLYFISSYGKKSRVHGRERHHQSRYVIRLQKQLTYLHHWVLNHSSDSKDALLQFSVSRK
jgi:hypothetical protein